MSREFADRSTFVRLKPYGPRDCFKPKILQLSFTHTNADLCPNYIPNRGLLHWDFEFKNLAGPFRCIRHQLQSFVAYIDRKEGWINDCTYIGPPSDRSQHQALPVSGTDFL